MLLLDFGESHRGNGNHSNKQYDRELWSIRIVKLAQVCKGTDLDREIVGLRMSHNRAFLSFKLSHDQLLS